MGIRQSSLPKLLPGHFNFLQRAALGLGQPEEDEKEGERRTSRVGPEGLGRADELQEKRERLGYDQAGDPDEERGE